MSGYGYGPPPPPPPPTSSSSGGYSRGSSSQRRGGPHGRGRGGQGHHNGQRHEHHASQPRYDYPPQPYAHHPLGATSYPPAPAASYPHQPPPPPQWGHEHVGHPAHAPAPMPAASYSAYPPQSYPPVHYTPPQQQVPYTPPQHYPYGAPPPPIPSQWNGSAQPHHLGGRPARGGYHDKGPRGPARPPNGSGYAQPYQPSPRAHHPPQHFPYGGPPPTPPSVTHHRDSQHGQYPRRGRGGHRDGGNRGRGGHHNDRHHNKPNQNPVQHKNDSASHGKKKKRKTNTLGLTPGTGEESEDDEGEEKTLSELLGQEALSNIGDVATFLAVRRQNYPTRARIEAKKAAAQAQRNEDKTASLEREADKLRKQLRKVESSIKRKREQGDEGDEMRGTSDNSSDDGPPETLSTKASSTTIPSRPLPAATGKRADVTRHCKYYSTGGTCGKKGKCRFVHDPAIREAAIKEREANHGRLTIQQRLILNDKEQEDLTVLRSIQYLRQKGIMPDAIAASAAALNGSKESSAEKDTEVKKEATSADKDPGPPLVVSSTSPYQLLPPPTSPPQVIVKEEPDVSTAESHSNDKMEVESDDSDTTKHYEGWLLQPYGSSGKGNVAP
ncbi:hypothetical protein MY4038_001266 [Beauveria bassiana]